MKSRQFKQLANLRNEQKLGMLAEGLEAIGGYVARLAGDLHRCYEFGLVDASVLLRNVAREEAGKFLILVDVCRPLESNHAKVSKQLARAGDHLSKLIYAQIADYSITDSEELSRAIETHRQQYRPFAFERGVGL